jgi:8-oxo-dGTP pyrophosphatase MutT (NUDIX family)
MSRERFVVVVHVLMIRNGQLFMLRRASTGFMDGFYALPGGHQEAGESISAAAHRECLEETGIVPENLTPVCVMPYRSGRHQGLNFIFETTHFQGEPRVNEPDLFDAGIWVDPDKLPEPVAVWLPDVLAMRSAGIWYQEFEWD